MKTLGIRMWKAIKLPLALGFFFWATSLMAAPPTNSSADRTPDHYQSIITVLDQLESKYPRDQVSFFQIRAHANALWSSSRQSGNLYSRSTTGTRNKAPSGTTRLVRRDSDGHGDVYAGCANLLDKELLNELQKICGNQVPVGYQGAQDIIFSKLDNHDGEVECVYTGRRIKTVGEPNATDMNVEHTWPQSQGAVGDAKCDLHHLFPTDAMANNKRSSFPFGNVQNVTWEQGGSKFDGAKFETRDQQKGDTARAKFYFAMRYGKMIPNAEEAALRDWSKNDPVSDYEKTRNNQIENFQHNRNPFVDHPEFIDQVRDF